VVREYRLVDNRSAVTTVLVLKPDKGLSLVEAQTPWFGGGLYVGRLRERADSAIVSLLTPGLSFSCIHVILVYTCKKKISCLL
jgi:hypothetical protein